MDRTPTHPPWPPRPGQPPPIPPQLIPPVSPRPSGPSARSYLRVVLWVLIPVGLAVGAAALLNPYIAPKLRSPAKETTADKHDEMARAFGEGGTEPGDPGAKEIEELLLSMARHIRAGEYGRAAGAFDFERMLQELQSIDGFPRFPQRERRSVLAGLRAGLRDSLKGSSFAFEWDRVEIKHIRRADRRGEFVVYARHREGDRASSYSRWWVTKSGGRWRIYDFEALELGARSTALMAALASVANTGHQRGRAVLRNELPRLVAAVRAGQLDRADRLLTRIHSQSLAGQMKAVCWMLTAALRTRQGRFKEALECAGKAEALNSDMPLLLSLRAQALNGLRRHQEALAAIREYRKLFGADAESSEILGDAYAGLGQNYDACRAYREGLRDEPNSAGNLAGLGLVLPVDQKEEVASHFARFAKPQESFEAIATEFLNRADDKALGALVGAYRKVAPKDPAAGYYAARVHIMRREFRRAADVIQAALPGVSDKEKRVAFVACYLDAMLLLGEPLEGYRNSPNKNDAFGYIAPALVNGSAIMPLAALIQAHRAESPRDIWLDYYTGQLHLLREEHEEAAKAHGAGWKRAADAVTRETFRVSYVYALYRGGKAMEAYRTVGPRDATFAQLARLYCGDNNADGLDALVGELGKADPKRRALPLWRAVVHWLRKQYAPAAKLLTENRQAMLADKDDGALFEAVLIDSLVYLKRFGDALQAARASTARDGDPYYEAVVQAAMGNAAETAALLEKLTQRGYVTAQFYANSHLRKALSSEALREVRKRFPPPEQPAGAGRKIGPDDL